MYVYIKTTQKMVTEKKLVYYYIKNNRGSKNTIIGVNYEHCMKFI